MNIRDIKDKLVGVVIPKDIKKEDFELTEREKKEIVEDKVMENEPKVISDEIEDIEAVEPAEEFKIKTVFVKEEDNKIEGNKKKLVNAAKIAAGIGVAAVGIAALILGSKKRR